jgi:hypothetical protein
MRTIVLTAVTGLMLAGCGNVTAPAEPATPPAAPSTVPATTMPSPETRPPSAPEQRTAPARRAALIRVPDVVGANHQAAQDTMQAAGLYNLAEKDATGRGRLLLWDRNWVVVRQTPSPGKRVPAGTLVTLFSKKIGE